jgi:hypothetical protein
MESLRNLMDNHRLPCVASTFQCDMGRIAGEVESPHLSPGETAGKFREVVRREAQVVDNPFRSPVLAMALSGKQELAQSAREAVIGRRNNVWRMIPHEWHGARLELDSPGVPQGSHDTIVMISETVYQLARWAAR